jgi:hypothetical protein
MPHLQPCLRRFYRGCTRSRTAQDEGIASLWSVILTKQSDLLAPGLWHFKSFSHAIDMRPRSRARSVEWLVDTTGVHSNPASAHPEQNGARPWTGRC